ncbi:MAG: helix-turn-helix domain-containing protein, partial [Ruthenibacterium sp.]
CGVGKAVESPLMLHESYLQAVLALHYRFFFGHIPCILGEEIEVQPTAQFDYSVYERQLAAALKQVSRAQTLAIVDAMFAQMQAQKLPYALCLRYCQRAVLQLLERMSEYLSNEEMARLERAWYDAHFFSATTLPQLHGMLREVCELSFDSFSRVSEDDATARVHKAEAYIREHYSDDTLSLNTIRDVFAISVSYFSAIFKAGTGYTFVEYLTQVRIEKAKELLKLTEKRTSEIAAEVGFADPHYFSVTFKRVTGLTPREYRTQQRALPPQGSMIP